MDNNTYSEQEIRDVTALLASCGSYRRIIEVASLFLPKEEESSPAPVSRAKRKRLTKKPIVNDVKRGEIDSCVLVTLRSFSKPVSASDVMRAQNAELSNAEVSLALKRLVRAGAIEQIGVRRGAKYEAKKP